MGLFKEVSCENCSNRTHILSRKKLTDGKYICSKCLNKLPYYLRGHNFTFETFQEALELIEFNRVLYGKDFKETRSYYSIHIDTQNYLFYLSDKIFGNPIDETTLFLRFQDIDEFDLIFSPDTYKEGTFADKIKGNVLMRLRMNDPEFYYEETVAYGVYAKVKKNLFSSKTTISEPSDLTDFLTFFNAARMAAPGADEEEDTYYEDNDSEYEQAAVELAQAKALFMIDDLSKITIDELKAQRNRLMKTFHPDASASTDTKYAQKINDAFEILKQFLSEAYNIV